MDTHRIIIGIVVVIILYIVYMYYFGGSSTSYLASQRDAKSTLTVPASSLKGGSSTDYTFSIWLYVNNWNYRLGEQKVILERTGIDSMALGGNINNITVSLATYSPASSVPTKHTCTLENIPLQAWVNVIMTLNNRSLDLYMDGKLVRTCVLPGVPLAASGTDLKVTPDGGFYGFISNLQYISRAVNPREAWTIYKEGYGGSNWLSNLLNKYRIKLAFMEDNVEVNSIEI
jgi:hypothetical protein